MGVLFYSLHTTQGRGMYNTLFYRDMLVLFRETQKFIVLSKLC